jgi:hypothetical protein
MPARFNNARPFASFFSSIAVPSICGIPQHTATHENPKNAGFLLNSCVAASLAIVFASAGSATSAVDAATTADAASACAPLVFEARVAVASRAVRGARR